MSQVWSRGLEHQEMGGNFYGGWECSEHYGDDGYGNVGGQATVMWGSQDGTNDGVH